MDLTTKSDPLREDLAPASATMSLGSKLICEKSSQDVSSDENYIENCQHFTCSIWCFFVINFRLGRNLGDGSKFNFRGGQSITEFQEVQGFVFRNSAVSGVGY